MPQILELPNESIHAVIPAIGTADGTRSSRSSEFGSSLVAHRDRDRSTFREPSEAYRQYAAVATPVTEDHDVPITALPLLRPGPS